MPNWKKDWLFDTAFEDTQLFLAFHQDRGLCCASWCRISTEEGHSPITIFHEENNTNPSIFFFQPEVSKHNTNMIQNYPPWFCGERKLSSWEGLGWCSWHPWCLCNFQQSSRSCHPTPAHGSHVFGPLWRDNAGRRSSPTSGVLQTPLACAQVLVHIPTGQVSSKVGLCA